MANKKVVYKATDSDGGHCIFLDLKDALNFIQYEIEGWSGGDLEEVAEDKFKFTLTILSMTERQIAKLPEYNP